MKRAMFLWIAALLTACGGDDDAARSPSLSPKSDAAVDTGGSSLKADAGLLADASDVGCFTCVDSDMPTWQLTDVQPKSAGFGKTYGLEAFRGKVTVVALLASW